MSHFDTQFQHLLKWLLEYSQSEFRSECTMKNGTFSLDLHHKNTDCQSIHDSQYELIK